MPIHETDLGRNRHLLNSINHAVDLGLNDAGILGLTTVVTLKAAIAAFTPHETFTNILRQINKNIDVGEAAGILTTGNITAADTVAGLEAICVALDANLVATERRTFAFQG
jgi:hypothetical protein